MSHSGLGMYFLFGIPENTASDGNTKNAEEEEEDDTTYQVKDDDNNNVEYKLKKIDYWSARR